MTSLREIRRKIKSVKSIVGRGPGLAKGNLYRSTRSGYRPRASAQQITKAMKMVVVARLRRAQAHDETFKPQLEAAIKEFKVTFKA